MDSKDSFMAISGSQLNRFERFLLWAALALAGLLIIARLGALLLLTVLRHFR
jgi:hypothetical protein